MNEILLMKIVIRGPNEISCFWKSVSKLYHSTPAGSQTLAYSPSPLPQEITLEKGPYLYCQPFALPPRLLPLLLLLIPPPQMLLLLFLLGVRAVARLSSFPSVSETFMVDTGSPPCIITPKSICPSWAERTTLPFCG